MRHSPSVHEIGIGKLRVVGRLIVGDQVLDVETTGMSRNRQPSEQKQNDDQCGQLPTNEHETPPTWISKNDMARNATARPNAPRISCSQKKRTSPKNHSHGVAGADRAKRPTLKTPRSHLT